jgi:hypothetical protein
MTIFNTALPKGEISVMRTVRKRKASSVWLAGIKTADFRLLHLVDRSGRLLIGQRIVPLDDGVLLNQLEELAGKLGIEIRYGNIAVEKSHRTGGLCRFKGQYVLIIHSRLTVKEKIGVITKTLKGFEMDDLYVIPVIRELLDKSKESEREGNT